MMGTAPYCLAFVNMLAASWASRTQGHYIIRAEQWDRISYVGKVGKMHDCLIKFKWGKIDATEIMLNTQYRYCSSSKLFHDTSFCYN